MSGDKTKLSKEIVQNIINNSPFFRKILYARPIDRYTLPQRKKKGE